ncbi:uncharacterized protein I303_105273 [Kwoniella dejecticola CBS 10117]|uniref:Histone-lysine N-methyltransferase, H3 lysine-4 specific n=1 Tax=Kwoniella dejecticola CBS 10117 TaxID=1296121 RepID=A0A1A6A2Y5_9TREE|nr:uncharacterized protein I303_05279 [Kwoniella dejecticola CBS 10117]OBR84421.1 hypothetical protein I303_05279 [Kwoniella dejecticola CBS 10117]
MAPLPSSSNASRPPPTGPRIPPTGPKALRNVNGATSAGPARQPPSGPSALLNGKHDKISFAFPQRATGLPEVTTPNQAGPSRTKINGINSPSSSSSPLNGIAKVSLNGESSRQSSSSVASPSTPFRISIPSGPSPSRNSSLNKFPSATSIGSIGSSTASSSQIPLKADSQQLRKPPTSPKKRHGKALSGDKGKSEGDTSYRANFLPTDESSRAKVSISLTGLSTGPASTSVFSKRPKPPHLANLPFERSSPNDTPPPQPPASPPPPPPPNGSRPLTPPLPPGDDRPPTPPPPPEYEDGLPPPPPSPPTQAPSPLPPPPPSAPKSFYNSAPSSSRSHSSPVILPPSDSRPPSPPPIEPPSPPPPAPPSPGPPAMDSIAPPSFHFRDLSIRRPSSPSKSEEDEEESPEVDMESAGLSQSSPPPPPKSPTPPYLPPPYIPPACVEPRPGLGNFLLVGKEKRIDGMINGQAVEVFDPRRRISKEQLHRGRGAMKNRSGYYEVEYEWDEYSTGPRPPPPPVAVLITGLSPLTTTDQISKFLRPHGRIKDIDAKMDTKSGMQLGICWVKFDGPPHGKKGTAHEVACQVVKACDGQRISLNGNEKIRVVLDGRGLRTKKAVEEEMMRRYPPPKPKVIPKPPTPALIPPTAAGTSTPSSAGAQTPRTGTESSSISSRTIPSIPKPLSGSLPTRPAFRPPTAPANFHASLPTRPGALPSRPTLASTYLPTPPSYLSNRPSGLPSRPDTSVQHLASSFTAAPFSRHASDHHKDSSGIKGRRFDTADSYTPDSRRPPSSRSRSRTPYSDYTSDYTSDSEDDARPTYRSREKSPYGRRRAAPQPNKVDEEAVEKVKAAIASNGLAHVFIDSKFLPSTDGHSNYVKDHFKMFKPSQILHNHVGWYILFSDNFSAYRAQRVLDTTAIQGHKLTLVVKTPPSSRRVEDERPSTNAGELDVEKGSGGTWKYLTITKKNRPAPPAVIPTGPKADRLKADKLRQKLMESDESSDENVPVVKPKKRLPSFSSASSLSDSEPAAPTSIKEDIMMEVDEVAPPPQEDLAVVQEKEKDDIPMTKGKKRPAKAVKVTKKSKKARLESPVPAVEILPPPEPDVAEITIEPVAEVKEVKKAVGGKKKGPKSEFDKFVATTVVDEEDAYWLGKALEAAKTGVEPIFPTSDEVKEEGLLDENHPLYHTSGSWRAEGFKKIPPLAKSSYLPQRNKATKAASTSDESSTLNSGSGVTTGRTARLAGRDQNRQVTTSTITDSELFAFNQLRIRKKQLRFARSAIEGYGLYAMETIVKGEMVCEYVGELCRAAIADVREQKYLKQGIGSSYLFRIDNDIVCDATFRGSVSRLINHSCDPSANAKIIKVNGQSKIVIYAERTLHPGEEILYDYKFPLESDPALRVPCLCGAATCRGWLN